MPGAKPSRSAASAVLRPEAAKAETARAGSGPEPAPATEALSIPSDPLPPPTRLPRPLAPSGVSAVLEDSADVASRSPFADGQSGSAAALERGSMIHRLLQVLPSVPVAEREAVLSRYLARALPEAQVATVETIEAQVLAVLEDPRFAPIFDAPARPRCRSWARCGSGVKSAPYRAASTA
jgi:ATP-dependent helicase/nuclease subunit A